MKLSDYEELLRDYRKREGARFGNAEHWERVERLLRHPGGQALIDKFPSPEQMHSAIRRHLEETLDLKGMNLKLGKPELGRAFMSLDDSFQVIRESRNSSKCEYNIYAQFAIPVSIKTDGGVLHESVLVDEDDNGQWYCRSNDISRNTVEQMAQRTVVLTVANRHIADRIVESLKDQVLSAHIRTPEQEAEMGSALTLAAVHGHGEMRKMDKKESEEFWRNMKEMGYGAKTPV